MRPLAAKDFLITLPISLILGAVLSAIQAGSFVRGLIGFASLFLLGLSTIVAAWRWAGGGAVLGWMVGLALALRLVAGVAVYIALPVNGHDEPDDRAGFVFTDAHRRDDQAWELAESGKPLWAAFDKSYYTDQYGGLLALSALAYEILSPDAHRPLLVLVLAALTAALGVPFFVRSAQALWNDQLAALAGWFFVLYPESILTGGAQMREPFLLTLIAMALWGFAEWSQSGARKSLIWIGGALAGMLLVSPAIALATLIVLGAWLRLRGRAVRISWPLAAMAVALFVLGLLALSWSLNSHGQVGGGSPLAIIANWFRGSVGWVIYQLERGSGQVQNVFSKLSPVARFFFVVGYGIAQPVLPPAFFAPTTLTWRVIAIGRASGWYALLPLLLYAPIAVGRAAPGSDRRVWTWLTAFSWLWIITCAVRAGGDQWDNPRYRLIFFGLQALVAAHAWLAWREQRDRWLPRIAAAEALCVVLFGQWYVARYYLLGIHLPILLVLSLGVGGVILILLGGLAWDGMRRPR